MEIEEEKIKMGMAALAVMDRKFENRIITMAMVTGIVILTMIAVKVWQCYS